MGSQVGLVATMVMASPPRPGVVGPIANCHSWHINGGYQLLTNWDGPPRVPPKIS